MGVFSKGIQISSKKIKGNQRKTFNNTLLIISIVRGRGLKNDDKYHNFPF